MCLHSWHDSPLCLAAPSSQPPKPAGSRRRREGLTAKARAEQQSSYNGCLAGALIPPRVFRSGGPPIYDGRVASGALDPRRSPLSKLCDARRINLYPVGIAPVPRSLMHRCEGKGAPRRMGPIFKTASCSHAPGRSRIHLGTVCSSPQFSRLHALIRPSERWPSAPRQFPGSAIKRSKACVPRQR